MPLAPSPPYPEKSHDLMKGKNVLVTAAAGTGIGFSAAKRFAEEGGTLFISDIHEKRLNEAADKIEKAVGRRPGTRLCNVTNEDEVRALVDGAIQHMGHIDVLVNNAGLGGTTPIVDMTDDQWHRVLDVSLTSVFRMTRAILPHMYARKTGCIVNNASVLGWRAQPGQAHYAAAKAGVMAFTRCAAMEAAPHNVRINAVSPSIAMHEFLAKVSDQKFLEELCAKEAMGRAAETWEIANVMVFLASGLSSFMTGEVVSVSAQRA